MSIFAISDLHLSSDNKKSMEVFGPKWADYMNRIKENWENTISGEDVVVIPGDISWGTYIEDCVEDFRFLDSLPGKKIIFKGNHDYWWTTLNKLNEFLIKNNFNSISFLNNNSVVYEGTLICGTRGWNCPEESDFTAEDRKIFNRELQRLRLSLETGNGKVFDRVIVALHFPPFNKNRELDEDFAKIFKKFKVDICLYGHLHGPSHKEAFEGIIEGTEFRFVAADYLGFEAIALIPSPSPTSGEGSEIKKEEKMKQQIKDILKKYKTQCDYMEIRIEKNDEQRIVVSGQEVETINNKIEMGGNVRVLTDGGWGSVSFNNLENIDEYAQKAIEQSRLVGKSESMLAPAPVVEDEVGIDVKMDPRSVSLEEKVKLFRHYNEIIHNYHKEIKLGRVVYFDKVIDLTFANSEGTCIVQHKVDIGCNIFCIAARGNDTQTQLIPMGSNGDYSVVLGKDEEIKKACKIAVELLDAPKVKGGKYTVIINPGLAGVFIHEAFGHLSEGDNVYENERLREIMKFGTQFGPEFLNVYDSGIEGNNRGDLVYDDEGVRTKKTYLIKNGKLVGRLHSRETAGKMGEEATGNARAVSYKFAPIPRMRTTCIEGVNSTVEEMIESTKLGVFAVDTLGGQTEHEMFTFSAIYGYMIRDGKIAELVRDVVLSGNVFDTLKNIESIGSDMKYCNSGGGCGKAGQFPLPVSEAAPYVKIKDVIVGGDAQ